MLVGQKRVDHSHWCTGGLYDEHGGIEEIAGQRLIQRCAELMVGVGGQTQEFAVKV